MRSKILLGGLLASVLTVPVFAQQSPAPSSTNPPASAMVPARTTAVAPMAHAGQWRASKLVGLNVYNDQNEKLGDINEILLDQSGKVTGVVIGVGGFLGMGKHDIMISMKELKFINEPVRTSATTTTTPSPTTTGSAVASDERTTTTTAVRANDEKWYPDHAVLSGVTKDQLKNMTEFKYN